MVPDSRYRQVFITPTATRLIARAYLALPDWQVGAVGSYKALAAEVREQYVMLRAAGMAVAFVDYEPYRVGRDLLADAQRGTIRVLRTAVGDNRHPFLSDTENDLFRAVHDYFGHVLTGRGFDRHGEEAAFQAHSAMFGVVAQRALATETRGQTAALIATGSFARQKMALLPAPYFRPAWEPFASEAERREAWDQAQYFHRLNVGEAL